jgi:hypothetical protein
MPRISLAFPSSPSSSSSCRVVDLLLLHTDSVPTACADTTGLSSKAVANSSAIQFVGGGAGTAPANYVLVRCPRLHTTPPIQLQLFLVLHSRNPRLLLTRPAL